MPVLKFGIRSNIFFLNFILFPFDLFDDIGGVLNDVEEGDPDDPSEVTAADDDAELYALQAELARQQESLVAEQEIANMIL